MVYEGVYMHAREQRLASGIGQRLMARGARVCTSPLVEQAPLHISQIGINETREMPHCAVAVSVACLFSVYDYVLGLLSSIFFP